jgi:tight adherence protein C
MTIMYAGIFATMFFAVALGVMFFKTPQERLTTQRLNSAVKEIGPSLPGKIELPSTTTKEKMGSLLVGFSQWLKTTVGAKDNPKAEARFQKAGIRSVHAGDYYFGARILLPAAGVMMGSFSPWNPFMVAIILAAAGYFGPDFYLDRKIKKRRERIRKSLPEVMDLLYVCVDAGLGMDQAMIRVAQSLGESHADMYEEIMRMGREQRAGKPRVDAWKSLAERTELPDVESFVAMLIQTERFGTPIARALAQFSDDLRRKRRQAAEERAAKTTVKMIFPLVLFIFPSLFTVLLGPALLSISQSLSGLGFGGQ